MVYCEFTLECRGRRSAPGIATLPSCMVSRDSREDDGGALVVGLEFPCFPHFHEPFAGCSNVDPIELSAQFIMKIRAI